MNDGRKRKAPKHQNKTAFKIQFDPLALEIHKKVSFKGLCKRCADQISWKLKYNKYKKMTQPAKCTFCHQKNVSRTYMRACQGCMQEKNVCPKCLETETQEQIQVKLNEIQQKKQDQQIQRKMNEFMKKLKQRSRRTVKRLFEKDAITWDDEQENFVDVEGNVLPVQFRQGYGPNKEEADGSGSQDQSYDQFGSDLDQDDEEEIEQTTDANKTKNKQKEPKKAKKQEGKQNKKSKKQKEVSESEEEDHEDHDDLDDQDQENEDDQEQIEDKQQAEAQTKQDQDGDWQDEQSSNEQVQQKHRRQPKKRKHKR